MMGYQNQDLQDKGASAGRVALALSSPVPGHVFILESCHWSEWPGSQSLSKTLVLQSLHYKYVCIWGDAGVSKPTLRPVVQKYSTYNYSSRLSHLGFCKCTSMVFTQLQNYLRMHFLEQNPG